MSLWRTAEQPPCPNPKTQSLCYSSRALKALQAAAIPQQLPQTGTRKTRAARGCFAKSPLRQKPPQYTRNDLRLTTSQDDVPVSLLDQGGSSGSGPVVQDNFSWSLSLTPCAALGTSLSISGTPSAQGS